MICPRCQTDVEHLSAHLVGEHYARVCVLCVRGVDHNESEFDVPLEDQR